MRVRRQDRELSRERSLPEDSGRDALLQFCANTNINTTHIYRQIQIQTVNDLLCYNSLQGNLTENCAAAAYKVHFKNFQEVAGAAEQ